MLHLLRDIALLAAPVVLIAAWWYIRNVTLYGDPTGLKVLNTFIKGRDDTPWHQLLLGEWESFRINFWGLFGGVNVLMKPRRIYEVLDVITLAALIGLFVWVAGRLRRKIPTRWVELGLAILYLVLLTIGVARYTLSTPATQGRLIFPALGVIMTLFALGLIGWVRPRWRPLIGVAGGGAAVRTVAVLTVHRDSRGLRAAQYDCGGRRCQLASRTSTQRSMARSTCWATSLASRSLSPGTNFLSNFTGGP